MLILINLLSTIPLTFVTSKTLNEYLHLSFGDERFPYLAEIGDYYENSDQEAISLAVGDDAMISIGCCSYQNGSHAGINVFIA